MRRTRTAVPLPDYAWMLDLLYGGKPSVTWAAAGSLPVGYERAEQLAELPSGPGRSFLVSLAARRGAASALTSFNALRSGRRRVVRRALGATLRTGLAQPLLSTKIDIGVRSAATPEQQAADLLTEHVSRVCAARPGAAPPVVAISGGAGPYRKPVLQVFSAAGTPLGFVKVGWNEWTRDGVRREAAALRACETRSLGFDVPKLLALSEWHGLDLLATAPLPDRVRGVRLAAPLPDASVLREISQLTAGSAGLLADSPWWRGIRARIQQNVTDHSSRQVLERIAGQLAAGYGDVPLEYGFCHGDFVPWNLARLGERLYVWDWESSAPDAPLGFDAVHYHFQVAFVGRGLPLGEATALAARSARPVLRELGVPTAHCGLVAVLHLVELFLRHEEARSAAGVADERFYPAVTGVLEQQLARIQDAAPGFVGCAT
jgi:Phosphotransferase enzyme family